MQDGKGCIVKATGIVCPEKQQRFGILVFLEIRWPGVEIHSVNFKKSVKNVALLMGIVYSRDILTILQSVLFLLDMLMQTLN